VGTLQHNALMGMKGIAMRTKTEAMSKQVVAIPANEAWVHTPEMQAQLKSARDWADRTMRHATDLDALDRAYARRRAALDGMHETA
jgi:hypothetical protein